MSPETLELFKKVCSEQGYLQWRFNDAAIRRQWLKIRAAAGLPEVTRQDFRKTCYTMMEMIGSAGSAQRLLEHSDRRVGKFYRDDDLILRWKIQQLPVKEWLSPEKKSRP